MGESTKLTTRTSFRRLDSESRRRFLALAGGGAAGLAFALRRPDPAQAETLAKINSDPFRAGLASGDPRPDSVVLWTRLVTDPFDYTGGLPSSGRYRLSWQVAADQRFTKIVRSGTVSAFAENGYAVHVEVGGLQPSRRYWYRFRVGGHLSPTASTVTAPAPDESRPLRFGFASCQNYRAGYFNAMRDAATAELDAMLFLGDFIYEYGVVQIADGRPISGIPSEAEVTATELADYRFRYALYRAEDDLQAVSHNTPFISTWDDHELANDYESSPYDLDRRAAAYRAFWENMPLRRPQQPKGADARMYRRLRYGRMAQLDVLDTRQYRDPMVGATVPDEGDRRDPDLAMLGAEQERWLLDGLGADPVRWNLLPQQLLLARLNTANAPDQPTQFSGGTWDGYQATQQRVFGAIGAAIDAGRVRNFVALGGDVHRCYASNVPRDTLDPDGPTIGVEVTSPSITSAQDFDPEANERAQIRRTMNPSLAWADLHCGYGICDLDADRMIIEVRGSDRVSVREDVRTLARFTVADGDHRFSSVDV
ncbi:MAG TPA: alkaline phosphatase D family protein [Microlunatus sp.]|nr:alkaline phosphatase D family protein [Microlunatus sp.]